MFKKFFDTFFYAVMGGICIALGGTAFLVTQNNAIGAVLFTVGLFTICTMGFNLYTGKVAYSIGQKPIYLVDLILIWLGNLSGTFISAFALSFTRIGESMKERAVGICNTKLSDNLISMFILAIFCNILIYIAVEGYKNNPHEAGKYLSLFFGVVVFIFCGFEHSIADMFYISVANMWSAKALLYVFVVSLGNAVGGMLIPAFKIVHKKLTVNNQ